jgi:hypothetical protein
MSPFRLEFNRYRRGACREHTAADASTGPACRCAREVAARIGLKGEVRLLNQTDFSEPLERFNTQPASAKLCGWSETAAWDAIADYYRQM